MRNKTTEKRPVATPAAIENFLQTNVMRLKRLAQDAPTRAKKALAHHIGALKLTPMNSASGPIYKVEGMVSLAGPSDAMLLVAGEGFEPTTFGL